MTTIIRIINRIDGVKTSVDGQYVVNYDPRLDAGGAYTLETSFDMANAKQFPTIGEATEYVLRACPNKHFDSPGHVNRPITCYNLEFSSPPDEDLFSA